VIVYADASALVKRYIAERHSAETNEFLDDAEMVATSIVSRAEVAAAFARAVRLGLLSDQHGRRSQRAFGRDWRDIARIPINEALVARAEGLAWDHALRGYDAVQLASALACQEAVGAALTVATFDRELSEAAREVALAVWPETLPSR
jgi:uncharacterized protein